jgi:hypothetical protein
MNLLTLDVSGQNVYKDYRRANRNEYTSEMTSQIASDFQSMNNIFDIYKWSNNPISDADTGFRDHKKNYKLACS